MEIKNIFCVGRNYVKHARELGNDVPDKPMIFTKPTNSIIYADNQQIKFPRHQGEIHYEIEVVLYIGKEVTRPLQVDNIVTKMALGIDFTLRDVQSALKEKGHPWLLAKGFKNATLLTNFWEFPGQTACEQEDFSLIKNARIVQQGNIKSLIFNFQNLIEYIDDHFGLTSGDIIFTGTPEGVGPITDKDELKLFWNEELKGSFQVGK